MQQCRTQQTPVITWKRAAQNANALPETLLFGDVHSVKTILTCDSWDAYLLAAVPLLVHCSGMLHLLDTVHKQTLPLAIPVGPADHTGYKTHLADTSRRPL